MISKVALNTFFAIIAFTFSNECILRVSGYVVLPKTGKSSLSPVWKRSSSSTKVVVPFLSLSKQDDDELSAFADSLVEEEDDIEVQGSSSSSFSPTAATAVAEKPETTVAELEEDSASWQAGIDELLNPATNIARRQIILSELVNSNQDIREDVMTALRDRKIDPLLTPNAKKVQDGTRAVARQLANDILPSIAKSASERNGGGIVGGVIPQPSDVSKVGSRILNAISNQVQKNLENLQEDLSNPVERIPQRITAQTTGVVTEVKNVFSETPEGLQEPPYTVVKRMKDYEIRDYEEYNVATTTMGTVGEPQDISYTNVATTGAAFNTLAAYLFGANQEGTVMDMTTPVTTTSWGEMRFFLSGEESASSTTSYYPEPLLDSSKYETGSVELKHIPAARLAVKRFTGFVTDGEISRQKDALCAALQLDGIEIDVPHGEPITHEIFQYNPPYTIPVVRRNEIAIPIREIDIEEDVVSSTKLETEWSVDESS